MPCCRICYPPLTEKTIIEKSSVDIIDQWCIFRGLQGPLLTGTDLRLGFPSLPSNVSSATPVTRSVHCEFTLLMDSLKTTLATGQTSGMLVPICVPICVCLLCGVYMDFIMRQYPHINKVRCYRWPFSTDACKWTAFVLKLTSCGHGLYFTIFTLYTH
jgi:hypothetical protein